MKEAASARKKQGNLSFSFDMLGEGARTDADALRYLASYQNAIAAIARSTDPTRSPVQNDGISIKLSALHPRFEDAQHARVMSELVPRVWQLCETAAAANLNLTIDAEEVDRPTAALIRDLKERGMWDETLVIWGGEFGRTPMGQNKGRDHHIKGFSVMLAGGAAICGGTSRVTLPRGRPSSSTLQGSLQCGHSLRRVSSPSPPPSWRG